MQVTPFGQSVVLDPGDLLKFSGTNQLHLYNFYAIGSSPVSWAQGLTLMTGTRQAQIYLASVWNSQVFMEFAHLTWKDPATGQNGTSLFDSSSPVSEMIVQWGDGHNLRIPPGFTPDAGQDGFSHTYSQPGDYEISLTVEFKSITSPQIVSGGHPVAKIPVTLT